MNRISAFSFVASCVLLTGACASTGSSSGQIESSRDVAEMKERILELQEQSAITQVEMDRLREQVNSLEKRLAGGEVTESPESSPSRSESPARVPPPAAAGNTDRAPIEESDLEPAATGAAVGTTAIQEEPQTEIGETDGTLGTEAPATLQPVEPAAQALYDRGYTLYHQGKYLDAEASFQRFLQAYPATELSDNAQFWIGESRYARGDISGALSAFRETLQLYPGGNKVPDALVKEGDCLAGMGDRDGARQSYEEVIRRFSGSAAAVMATERLADLP